MTVATAAPAVIVTKLVSNFYLGCDLGQVSDYTALAVLKHTWARWVVKNGVQTFEYLPAGEMLYHVVHLERLRLGMAYPEQVALVKSRFDAIPVQEREEKRLVVDATGVGRAVVDLMRAAPFNLEPIPITIIGSSPEAGGQKHSARHVPKRDLVASLNVLMQSGRFKIAAGLTEGKTLANELANFRYKLTNAANVQYEAWREGLHDDMVLAVALPAWLALMYSRGA